MPDDDRADDRSATGLEAAGRTLSRMIASAPGPLRRASVRHGDLAIELEWPEGTWAPAAPAPAATNTEDDAGLHYISSSMVATFYVAPQPGAEPFVQVGDVVRPGQQVAILEAMKMMIPVEADRAGEVAKVLVPDGSPVEFGERLIALTTAEG